jgi:hypothetical protein
MPFPNSNIEYVPANNSLDIKDFPLEIQQKLNTLSEPKIAIDMIAMGARFLVKTQKLLKRQKVVDLSKVHEQLSNELFKQFSGQNLDQISFAMLLNGLFVACDHLLEEQLPNTTRYGSPTQNMIRSHRKKWLETNRLRVIDIFESKLNLRENLNATPDTLKIYIELITKMDRAVVQYFYPKLPKQQEAFDTFEEVLNQFANAEFSNIFSQEVSSLVKKIKLQLLACWEIEHAPTQIIKPIQPPIDNGYLEPEFIIPRDQEDIEIEELTINSEFEPCDTDVSPTINTHDIHQSERRVYKPVKPLLSKEEIAEYALSKKIYFLFGDEQNYLRNQIHSIIDSYDSKYKIYYQLLVEIFINQNFTHGFSDSQDCLSKLNKYLSSFDSQLKIYLADYLTNAKRHYRRTAILQSLNQAKTAFSHFNIYNLF